MDIKQLNEELSKALIEENNDRKAYITYVIENYSDKINSIAIYGTVYNVSTVFAGDLDKENAPIIILDDAEETELTLQDLLDSNDVVFYELKPIE